MMEKSSRERLSTFAWGNFGLTGEYYRKTYWKSTYLENQFKNIAGQMSRKVAQGTSRKTNLRSLPWSDLVSGPSGVPASAEEQPEPGSNPTVLPGTTPTSVQSPVLITRAN